MNWSKLQNVDRRVLYVILLVATSLGLFLPSRIPNDPEPAAKDLYALLMQLPEDKPVIIQSDWTNSTRGETMGHLEALCRILMSRRIKFVIYATADAQAGQVALNVIRQINEERKKAGLVTYREGVDYIYLGVFPNAEGAGQNMRNDIRKAWGTRQTKVDGQAGRVPVFDTAVLRNMRSVSDASLMVVITASATIDVAVQRLSDKVTMACMSTGVVAPSLLPFYQAGQLKGFAGGLRGAYDMEYMMAHGINYSPTPGQEPKVTAEKFGEIPPVPEGKSFERAARYFGTLHIALTLLILAVVMGNVGMFVAKKKAKGGNN
ncbi:MAG: hypothetical protein MUC92_06745 [Fimbriimonadaceae bacterium]|jgi:hypothetical protein|nr:hypothetical protein [Fimbriimonadaceae bacterium]